MLAEEAERWTVGTGHQAFVEFFWGLFLRPSIETPELRGVIEPFARVSSVARRNLVLIAQVCHYLFRVTASDISVAKSPTALPPVTVDVSVGTAETQHATVELLNGQLRSFYVQQHQAFTSKRVHLLSKELPNRAAVEDELASVTQNIIACSLAEISLLHAALLAHPRLLGTPSTVAGILQQLGAPIAVSAESDVLMLLKLTAIPGMILLMSPSINMRRC